MTHSRRNRQTAKNHRKFFGIAVIWWLGLILLLLSMTTSILLSAKHIWAIHIPGCGITQACNQVINGPWGHFLGWPVAFIGTGYFATMMILWVITRKSGTPPTIKALIMLSALVSVVFIGIMLIEQLFCVWCLATHTANISFSALIWHKSLPTYKPARLNQRYLLTAVLMFSVILLGERLLELQEQLIVQASRNREALASLSKIENVPETKSEPNNDQPDLDSRFGGRYWKGSQSASVRIVMFHDYRCELCRQTESEIELMMQSRNDIALSVKQWPFDSVCNPHLLTTSPHPSSCLSAKAAESTGLIGGRDAFWKMNHWLMGSSGEVSLEDVTRAARSFGLDSKQFIQTLQSSLIDSIIQADIAEGVTYGLTYTPMIFVNGYELKGWQTPGALPAMITRIAQMTASRPRINDKPDSAAIVEYLRWQKAPVNRVDVTSRWSLCESKASKDTIVVFGDLTCPYNASVISSLDGLLEGRSDVRLVFRYFPLDGDCNPQVNRLINPNACEAAQIAESASLIGDLKAYRRTIRWLIANREQFSSQSMSDIAETLGLSTESLIAESNGQRVSSRIQEDVLTAKSLGIVTSPTVFINGKKVNNWRTPGLFDKILAEQSN